MVNYREILRLHSLNYSQREIASSVHNSRDKVSEVIRLATSLHIKWPLEDEVINKNLESFLYPERVKADENRMPIDYPKINQELAQKGVTLSLLWTEYCSDAYAAGKTPYMSTQFGNLYRKWARVSKATMRFHHKPGDNFEVDWACKTLPIYDNVTVESTEAYYSPCI